MGVLTRIRRWGVAIAIAHGAASAVAQVAPPPVPPNPRLAAAIEQNEGIKPLVMTTEEVPVAYAGLPYHSSLRMEGGERPYSVFVSGDFPPGLVYQTGFNVVTFSGVPTVAGTFSAQVAVYDVNGVRMTHDYTFVVRDISLSTPPPAVIPDPEAMHINDAESVFFPAVINVSEAFHIDDSLIDLRSAEYALPEAFHINDQTTVILAEQYALPEAFHINDATTVKVLLGVTPTTAPTGNVNVAYSQTFTAVGNTGAAMLTPSGALPNGMSFTTTAGSVNLSGTPTQDGRYPFTITAQDSVNTVSVAYSLHIVGISQTITFTPPTSPAYYGASPITLVATGGASGNPVTFSIVSGPGSLSGTNNSILTLTGGGTIVIAANQAGNTDYAAAPQVTQSITVDQPAVLTSPAPGGTLVGPSVTFTWTAAIGSGNQGYWLFLGTTGVGSKDLYDSGQQTATSATFKSLPNKGETIYARVYTKFNGVLVYNDYTYSTVTQAVLTSPTPGSTLVGPSVTFTWSAASGPGNQGYWLYLGTTGVGSKDLYDSGQQTATSATFKSLPNKGETIYARVYTKFNGVLVYNDYTYSTVTQAVLTSPTPSSTLVGPSITFSWSAAAGPGNEGYWLYLGTTGIGSKDLYDSGQQTATSATFNSLPNEGETIYARVYTKFNGTLVYNDYTYSTVKQAVLTSPTPGSTLAGSSQTFTWTAAAGPGNEGYWLFLGTTGVGSKNLYDSGQQTATSATFNGLPTNGATIYARVYTKFNGTLVYHDYTYIAMGRPAVLTSPTPGSTLTSASATFTWTSEPGNQGYWLFLGTTGVGSKNLYDSGQQAATSATFNNLPTNGATIYARVYTKYNGTLFYNDYTYKAWMEPPVMTSPTPGSTLAGASVTFSWTAETGSAGYWLFLGTTGVGSKNLYDSGQQTATSATFNGLPTNGATIYARVYTKYGSVLVHNDYTYKAK